MTIASLIEREAKMKPKRGLSVAQIRELVEANRVYYPCSFGVHVCGSDDTKNAAITVANVPARNEAEARMMFEACRSETEARGDDPHDLVVDLNIGRDNLHVEDFWLCRQMLERCVATALRTREAGEK